MPTTHAPVTRLRRLAFPFVTALAFVLIGALALGDRPFMPTAHAGRLAGIAGDAITGIQLQNLDPTASATIGVDFMRYDAPPDTFVAQIARPGVPPWAALNMYVPSVSELTTGLYALAGFSDRPLAAVARTDWPASGAAALYRSVVPGTDVFVPLAVIGYYGQTSLIAVQNADQKQVATVDVALIASGQTAPADRHTVTIQPSSATLLDLATVFGDIQPNMAGGLLGALRVSSSVPVGVMSFVHIANSPMAVYAFEGAPASGGGKTLFAPLVVNRDLLPFGRSYSTGIAIENQGATAVHVTVTYRGSYTPAWCNGHTFRDGPLTIPPSSNAVIYQPASATLPSDCMATAVIEADGAISAVVSEALNLTEQAAAYNAVPAAQGAKRVMLPLVRRQHTANKLTTGIQVMNVGDAAAHVALMFFDNTGRRLNTCGDACKATIPPFAAASFYPSAALNAMPVGMYGSAVVESDEPVVAIVNDVSEAGTVDMATYNGINADDVGAPADPTAPFRAFVTFAASAWVKPGGP